MPEERARGEADQRRLFGPAGEQARETRPGARGRDRQHPEQADDDRERRAEPERIAQDQDAENRGLHRLGLGIGRADRKVAERERVQKQRGRGDLG